MQTELNRRDALKAAGGAGLAAVFGANALEFLGDDAEAATTTTCLLTPEVTEGPYWVEEHLTRRNITEGKAGLPLVIRFTILNAKTCTPIPNADVEIWHCDALGNYSAVNGATTRFLRGHQKLGLDRQGRVPDDLPRLVPRPHSAHPHEGVASGATPSTPARSSSTRRSREPSTSRSRTRSTAVRHAARAGHDLPPGGRLDGRAEAEQADGRASRAISGRSRSASSRNAHGSTRRRPWHGLPRLEGTWRAASCERIQAARARASTSSSGGFRRPLRSARRPRSGSWRGRCSTPTSRRRRPRSAASPSGRRRTRSRLPASRCRSRTRPTCRA